jgi:ATP-binding protein involved in chromosome partitioning
MAILTEAEVRSAVESYVDPFLWQSLGEARAVRRLEAGPDGIVVEISLGYPVGGYEATFADALRQHLAARGHDGKIEVLLTADIPAFVGNRSVKPLAEIANVVAVASGKGGVGKSTVAANLALALHAQGARIGLLDADIYGPSQPRMMGLAGQRPATRDGRSFEPLEAYGVKVMSIGFLIDDEQPMVWRGPMVTQALTQLLNDTHWGPLDYLIVDMPPGTGDTQLTLAQKVPVSGAVIVTTPQDIALLDARKGLRMFQKVEIPVLGVVENMAGEIFGEGGGEQAAQRLHVPFLGRVYLDRAIRQGGDAGQPIVAVDPANPQAQAFHKLAMTVAARVSVVGFQSAPELKIM